MLSDNQIVKRNRECFGSAEIEDLEISLPGYSNDLYFPLHEINRNAHSPELTSRELSAGLPAQSFLMFLAAGHAG